MLATIIINFDIKRVQCPRLLYEQILISFKLFQCLVSFGVIHSKDTDKWKKNKNLKNDYFLDDVDYGAKETSNKIEIASMTEIKIQNWTWYNFIASIDSRKKVNKELKM